MNTRRLLPALLAALTLILSLLRPAGGQNLTGDVWTTPAASLGVAGITDMTLKGGSEYWAVGSGGVFKSTNMTTWSKVTTTGLHDLPFTIRWTGTKFVLTGFGVWTSTDGVAWTRRFTLNPRIVLGTANRGETVIAAGALGRVYRSTDGGLTWTWTDLGQDLVFSCVAATPTHFVIAGNGGILYNSPDGINWTPRNSGTSQSLWDVTYAGTRLVAVGGELTVTTSTDNGNTWSAYQALTGTGLAFRAVAGDSSMTVISGPGQIAYAANPSAAANLNGAAIPNFQTEFTCALRSSTGWVLGGYGSCIATATTPSAWTLRHPLTATHNLCAVRTSANFITAGFPGDKVTRSADGITWATAATGIPATEGVTCMAWNGARLLAGTASGKIYTTTSNAGASFAAATSGTTNRLNASVWTGSQFLMFGNSGTILSSTTGTSWTARSSGTAANLYSGATSGTVHIAVGVVADGSPFSAVVLTSTNGISWTQTYTLSGGYGLFSSGWNGTHFTVGGLDGLLLTSPDGVNWTERTVNPSADGKAFEGGISSITWANTNWIAVTTASGALLSRDGVEWKHQDFAGGRPLDAVIYANSRAVAVGENGQILTSVATAPRAPLILVPPMDLTLAQGETGVLSCLPSGTPDLSCQWRKNGVNIDGAVQTTLPLPNAGAADSGSYDAVITGAGGTTISPAAIVRVQAPPVFTIQPLDARTTAGGSAAFTVETTGAGPITYQWFKIGTGALAGKTSATLTLTGITNASAGEYYAEATNEYGGATSSLARLVVTIPLEPALDLPAGYTVQTQANGWYGITEDSHDGVDTARSGTTPDSGTSSMQLTVTGMASVNFWWNVSSESCCDSLRFSINSAAEGSISGQPGWQQVSRSLDPAAVTVLRWEYVKDSSVAGGLDRGWVDQITFSPPTPVTDFPWWAAASLPADRREPSHQNGPLLLENTLSYALGINPLTATSAQLPTLQKSGSQWIFTYTRTTRISGISYVVEWSASPASAVWSTAGVAHSQTATGTTNTTWRATITPPPNSPRLFFRLRVSL